MCLDAKEKSSEDTPVTIYDCHGQGGNQVSTSVSTSSEHFKEAAKTSSSRLLNLVDPLMLLGTRLHVSVFCFGCLLSCFRVDAFLRYLFLLHEYFGAFLLNFRLLYLPKPKPKPKPKTKPRLTLDKSTPPSHIT